MTDEHKSAHLFLAISHAALQRQQKAIQKREEQQDLGREWEEELMLKPQKAQKEEEEAEAKMKELKAEALKEELKIRREECDKRARRDRLSRAEVDEEVLGMVEEVHRAAGLGKRRMEDGTEEPYEQWRGRMANLRRQIYQAWNENQGRINMGLPRYVEGYPVREWIKPPKFLPWRMQEMSGLTACLQCQVKGLACSRSVLSGRVSDRDLKSKWCKRCEAEGERCIVEWEVNDIEETERSEKECDMKKTKKEYMWDWVDRSSKPEPGPGPGPDTESVAEAVEMWERRRRGAKLELVGDRLQWVEMGDFAPRKLREEY
ncbi:hypothetical protein Trco_006817 [Trichoderma cornu-damae]|uniref:Uncharacterized protein n=1 Tax=Trichoderma cornu-damae TaxID=654480 RepID=A0A9P8QH87_9HYPO|nr:hypothetical protein Trco_006817 [Trichoderma cornu-damae]